jgi:hypothetical protein
VLSRYLGLSAAHITQLQSKGVLVKGDK